MGGSEFVGILPLKTLEWEACSELLLPHCEEHMQCTCASLSDFFLPIHYYGEKVASVPARRESDICTSKEGK